MKQRDHLLYERYVAAVEAADLKVSAEKQKTEEKKQEKEDFYEALNKYREQRELKNSELRRFSESVYNNYMETALGSIYIAALQEVSPISEDSILLAQKNVANYIEEHDGARSIIRANKGKTSLLDTIFEAVSTAANKDIADYIELREAEEKEEEEEKKEKEEEKNPAEGDENASGEDIKVGDADKDGEDDADELDKKDPITDEPDTKETLKDDKPKEDEKDTKEESDKEEYGKADDKEESEEEEKDSKEEKNLTDDLDDDDDEDSEDDDSDDDDDEEDSDKEEDSEDEPDVDDGFGSADDTKEEESEEEVEVEEEPDEDTFDDDGGLKDNKEEMFKKLENDAEVTDAVDIIAKRISDAETEFIQKNAEDKKKIEQIVNKVDDRIKAVTDSDKTPEEKEQEAQETQQEATRLITDIKEQRFHSVFEELVKDNFDYIMKDDVLKENYTDVDGTINVAQIVESTRVMYGFLEFVNTIQLEKVNSEYILKVIKNQI